MRDDGEIYRSILENLPTALCLVDANKKIVLWSEGAKQITGYLGHELIGHSCLTEPVLHCNRPGYECCKEDCPMARAMKISRPTEAMGFICHKKGHKVPIRICAVPVHNPHGSVIGAVETFEIQPSSTPGQHEDIMKMAGCFDQITGLASHTTMLSHLREALRAFSELQLPFGILCFRLEGLDRFRAAFGPEPAACLLRAVARSLESAIWRTDFVGRWAEDQFLVIVNGCGDGALHSVCERLRGVLAHESIEWWGEQRSLPVSVGEATVQDGDTEEQLTARALQSLEAGSAGQGSIDIAGSDPSPGS